MIGRPLIVMPAASTSSRVGLHERTGIAGAVARHVDHAAQACYSRCRQTAAWRSARAPEIDVRDARRYGARAISAATASAASGPVDQPPRHDDLLVSWPAHSK